MSHALLLYLFCLQGPGLGFAHHHSVAVQSDNRFFLIGGGHYTYDSGGARNFVPRRAFYEFDVGQWKWVNHTDHATEELSYHTAFSVAFGKC